MLTKEQIEQNKLEFLKLLGDIDDERIDTEGLVNYLLSTDFFTAPASTKYGCAYEGGLVKHTLNVYNILNQIVGATDLKVSPMQITLVALLHDVVKANFYETYIKSTKQPVPEKVEGAKWDGTQWFVWENKECYKVKEAEDRETVGSKGLNVIMTLSKFIPLMDSDFQEVMLALANQYDGTKELDAEFKHVLNSHPLVVALHTADVLACYIKDYE